VATSLAIVGATIVTMNDAREIIDEGTVVIERGRFVAVGRGVQDPSADCLIRAKDSVLLPGLINCHLHTRPGRALGDGLSLFAWHAAYPDTFCRQMTDADSRAGGLLAFADSLKRGTTTVIDMTCKPGGAFAAAEEIGIRARIVPLAADSQFAGDGACDIYAEFIETLRARRPPPDARVQYWLGFDAVNGLTEATLRQMARDAQRLGVGIHGHMSESRDDAGWTDRDHALPAAIYLQRAGVLGPRTVLAHCNWLTPAEIEALAKTGTSVAHNPTSNMKLGTGVAPVLELRARGVTVGLGTDGMLSNFHLDMFEVMRAACMLQRIHRLDAHALMSWDVLEMATRGGAGCLGRVGEIGELSVGAAGDLVCWPQEGVAFAGALTDPVEAWLRCGPTAARHTVVAGRVLVRDSALTVPGVEEMLARHAAAAARLQRVTAGSP